MCVTAVVFVFYKHVQSLLSALSLDSISGSRLMKPIGSFFSEPEPIFLPERSPEYAWIKNSAHKPLVPFSPAVYARTEMNWILSLCRMGNPVIVCGA
jgi:hypothetical protein